MSVEEREVVSREVRRNRSARYIEKLLGRHHSTISRELGWNGGPDDYRAIEAQARCDAVRARLKPGKLEASRRLHEAVNDGLAQQWSPKQISRRLQVDYPDDEALRICHATVYECLYLQAGGELRTQLKLALRRGRTRRVHRPRSAVIRG